MPIGFVWQNFLETPLINFLVALSALTFGSYGLAILVFTVITRVITFPLTLRTLRATKRMQEIQPRLQELQKKYSDPRRRSEETMKLYRESGVNPLGCLGPQLLQMPIFIAMYQVIRITLGNTPEGVLYLESRLYDFDMVQNAAPLSTRFLFIDLGASGYNPSSIMLMLVVFSAMWLQQRISASRNPATDSAQQRQMNQMMQWFMPALFAWFVVVVPAGLGLYWASTTVIGILLHWVFIGPGDFKWASLIPEPIRTSRGPSRRAAARPAIQPATASAANEARNDDDEQQQQQRSGDQRRRRRRRDRSRAQATRPQSQSGRRRRRPRR